MPKTITMVASVTFDFKGTVIKQGATFNVTPIECVQLQHRRKATMAKKQTPSPGAVPNPVPVAQQRAADTSPVNSSVETSDLTPSNDDDDAPQQDDAPATGRGRGRRSGRGQYQHQDLRPQP